MFYPVRNNSPNFRQAELIKMGKGNFSNNLGNLTMASHRSPNKEERRPEKNNKLNIFIYKHIKYKIYDWAF